MKKKQSGFTLIELLVVIGILAVLMAIVLVAINPARQFRQSNQTRRTADINAILNAITQFGADTHGAFALTSPSITLPMDGTMMDLAYTDTNGVAVCDAIIPRYMASIPADPDPTRGSGTMPTAQGTGAGGCGATSPAADWVTGYWAKIDTNGRVTVYATNINVDDGTVTGSVGTGGVITGTPLSITR